MRKLLILTLTLLVAAGLSYAQIVTATPVPLQNNSTDVVLTYHPDAPGSNKALAGLTAATPIYAHIGVITNRSDGEWKYDPTWLDNAAKYRLTYVSANTWTLSLGDMRKYFGMTDPAEIIEKVALVFRTADGSKEGKTSTGGDIFVDVAPDGYAMAFSANRTDLVLTEASTLAFTANVSEASTITIDVNGKAIATVTGQKELTATHNFTDHGFYAVTATATNGTETRTSTLNVAFPTPSQPGTYPGGVPKMGATRNADGTVTFCLAAPNKTSVILVPSWDNYQMLDKNIMKYQDYQGQRYFFTTVSGLDDDTWYPYYYLVDGIYKVGDPYARLVLDPYSDKWLNKDIWPDSPKYPYELFNDVCLACYKGNFDNDFAFSDFTIPDHRTLVIYEMLLRDFTGTDGKALGDGTTAKAIEKIPYLRSLGVTAVELMPVMEFNGNNSWGYNTNFYMAPDKAYGSPEELKRFVEACHSQGIAVILDIALNHSDGLAPWYIMYGGVNNNPFYNAVAPHDYSVLNDWNQKNPLVQQMWRDTIKFWMTVYNVDGFRFDLVKGLGTEYPSGTEAYNASRVEMMKKLHQSIIAAKPNGIHINENLAGVREENEMAADGQMNWANINNNSCQYAMGFAQDSNLARFLAQDDGGRTAFSTVAYAESHDEQRVAYKVNEFGATGIKGDMTKTINRLSQLACQEILTPGAKMIWQFEELADAQKTKNSNGSNNTDPKIVVWNYLQDSQRMQLHDVYKALNYLRKDNPELFDGTGTFVATGFANNLTGNRIMRLTNGSKEVMCFINPNIAGANRTVGAASTVLNANNCQLICASSGFTPKLNGTGTSVSVSVPANGFAVYATNATNGVNDIIGDDSAVNVSVYGSNGRIVIVGEYTDAAVYTVQGQRMSGLDVTPGLYIVVVDGSAHKVAVN